MNRKIFPILAVLFFGAFQIFAQGTTFFYQGHLNDGGSAANGNYDFQFSLFDASTNGNLIAGPQTNSAVTVSGGLFNANINFGSVFTGTNYWLAIGVRSSGTASAFTTLQPLQPILPTPYAIFANTASNLSGSLPATQLSGTLSSAQLSGTYSSAVNFTNPASSFAGNGIGLTNLNGSQITTGTVADARLSTNVALLNANQTFTGSNYFTGANSFTNRANNFAGSFFGNGLVGWMNVTATAVQALPDTGYLLLSPSLTTVTLPPTSSLLTNDIVRVSGGGLGGWQVAQNAGQSVIGNFSGYGSSLWLASSAASANWANMASSSDGSLMAAVQNASALVYLSTDFGHTWNSSLSPTATWRSIACSADGSHLITGQLTSGAIYYSTNYGVNWSSATVSSGNWYSIAMSANGSNAVAVSAGNGIYTSTNFGASWRLQTNNTATWASVASSANGSNLVAVANSGTLYTSANAGSSWAAHTVGSGSLDLMGVACSADGSKIAVAVYGGGIYLSANFGSTWQQSTAPSTNYWESIAMSSDGARISAVAYGGGIYTSINFGSTWFKQSAPTANWGCICGSADGTKLAAGIYVGGIYYPSSATQNSTTVGTGGYLSGAQGSAVELQYIGNGQFMPVSSAGTFWAN